MRWPDVIARLVATVVVVVGLAWVAKTVGRGSLRTAWEGEPSPLLPGTQTVHTESGLPLPDAEGAGSPELKAKLRRMVDLINELRGRGAVGVGPSTSMQASEIEVLSGLIGGAGLESSGADPPGLRLPESARRLYGVAEASESGRSYVAVYRVGGRIDEAAERVQKSFIEGGWATVRAPQPQGRGGRVLRYRREKEDVIVYLRPDRLSGETTMILNLSVDQ